MSAAVANLGTAQMCDTSRTELRLTANVMRAARNCWSVKTRLHLAEITGYSVRACESWLAGERKIPADALAALIRSDWGRDFLAAVMAESRAPWWRRFLRIDIVASVKRRHAADRRLLEQVLEADCETFDAVARAEAAFAAVSVHDPEFHGMGHDALRNALRVPGGAVAQEGRGLHKSKARSG